jgi:AcrR family transcriptional regulator
MSTLEKPLRADARRNREKVLAAARAVFAEQGIGAQMDDVARRLSPLPDEGRAAQRAQ